MNHRQRLIPSRSVTRLLLAVGISIFVGETLVMLLLDVLPPLPRLSEALRDATLLSVSTLPILYFLVFRPLKVQMAQGEQAQAELRVSEQSYRYQFAKNSSVMLLLDPAEGTILDANAAAVSFYGYPRERLLAMRITDINPLPAAEIHRVMAAVMQERSLGFEFQHRLADGSLRDVEVSSSRIESGGRSLLHLIIQDATERKQATAELSKLSQVVEQTPASVVIADPAGNIQYVNPAFVAATGYTAAEALGQNPRILKSGRMPEEIYAEMWRQLTAGETWRGELQNRRKDGQLYWELAVISPVRDRSGKTLNYVAIQENITARKQAETALAQEHQLLRTLIHHLPDAIYAKDTLGRKTLTNPADLRIQGRTTEAEVLGRDDFAFYPPEIAAKCFADDQAVIVTGQPVFNREESFTDAQGHPRWFLTSKLPLCSADGQVIGLVGISHDITERKEAEVALRASLAEKITLLKEVHHRVKNNLQIITSLLNLQAEQVQNAEVLDLLAVIRNRVGAMALLHENLYQSDNFAHLNVANYVESLCTHLLHATGPVHGRVRLEHRVENEKNSLRLDQAVPFGLLINELVTNALKHAFPGERPGLIQVKLERPTPHAVLLTVADDGVGLPATLDPRHTQSLGLQLVFLLTEQLHGTVNFERGNGTTVQILFSNPVETETSHE